MRVMWAAAVRLHRSITDAPVEWAGHAAPNRSPRKRAVGSLQVPREDRTVQRTVAQEWLACSSRSVSSANTCTNVLGMETA